MSRGFGPLAAVHRIFMLTALVCALAFAASDLARHGREGLPRAAVALAVAGGIGLYLRSFRTRRHRLAPPEEEEAERRYRG
jgi:hypothetical protein